MSFAKPLALAVLCGSVAYAQSAPAFEAASIKPSGPDSVGGVSTTSTQFVWTKTTLKQLIRTAFNLRDYSFSPPAWMDSAEFDLAAKIPSGTPPNQVGKMLQNLVVERFKLTYHLEPRTTNGYAMVVAKEGLKIHPVEGGEQGGTLGPDRLIVRGTSLAQLANLLSSRLNRPVLDQTGTAGSFDINIKWTLEPVPQPATSGVTPEAVVDAIGPALINALQEQVGLKLEVRKVPVDVMVIDHAEKSPVEN